MDKPSELHIAFFQSLVSKSTETKAEIVIFDRLYLTQAFRANATMDDYKSIEDSLMQYPTLTVFLKVDEDVIAERVRLATLHREESWGEYVKTKGDTFTEIADHYINQQRNQLALLKKSKVEYLVLNTTNHGYDQVVREIVTKL
jgi:thymidylate kinase